MDDPLTQRLRKRLTGARRHRTDFLAAQPTIRALLKEGYSGPAIHRELVKDGKLRCSYRTWRRLMLRYIERDKNQSAPKLETGS